MFGKKPEPGPSDEKSAETAAHATPEKNHRPDLRNPSAQAPMQPSSVSQQAAAPSSMKPTNTGDGSAVSSLKSSVISAGFEFTGDMKSDGSLTVDGIIKGNLIVQTLLIGETGLVDGSVKAESISVEGRLSGAASCKDLVIGNRAVVDGQMGYSTITIQRGGTIKGDLKRA